jgi:hypothetical protein
VPGGGGAGRRQEGRDRGACGGGAARVCVWSSPAAEGPRALPRWKVLPGGRRIPHFHPFRPTRPTKQAQQSKQWKHSTAQHSKQRKEAQQSPARLRLDGQRLLDARPQRVHHRVVAKVVHNVLQDVPVGLPGGGGGAAGCGGPLRQGERSPPGGARAGCGCCAPRCATLHHAAPQPHHSHSPATRAHHTETHSGRAAGSQHAPQRPRRGCSPTPHGRHIMRSMPTRGIACSPQTPARGRRPGWGCLR